MKKWLFISVVVTSLSLYASQENWEDDLQEAQPEFAELLWAVGTQNEQRFHELLVSGIRLDATGRYGRQLIHALAQWPERAQFLRMLLADDREAYKRESHLVYVGARQPRIADGRYCIAVSPMVTQGGIMVMSPLHLAVGCGNHQAVALLLEAGADTQVKGDVGNTLLQTAQYFIGMFESNQQMGLPAVPGRDVKNYRKCKELLQEHEAQLRVREVILKK